MKIIKIILFSLLLLKSNFSIAQNDSVTNKKFDKFYISLTGGSSFPVGDFANYEDHPFLDPKVNWISDLNLVGAAKSGFEGRLIALWFFIKNLGCIAAYCSNYFKVENNKIADELMAYNMYQNSEHPTFSYNSKLWTTQAYMAGLAARIPFNKSAFSFKFLAGSQRSVLPEVNIAINNNPDAGNFVRTEDLTQLSATSSDFVWNAGMDYKIRLGKYIAVVCSADYTRSAEAAYKGMYLITWKDYVYINTGPYQYDFIRSYQHTRKISFISVTAGIAYIFK